MYIYKITNKINNKIYIGLSTKDPSESEDYFGSGRLIMDSISKYGIENFTKEILENDINSIEDLSNKERYYISLYNSIDKSIGYNISEGGIGNHGPMKDSTKESISNSLKGNQIWKGKSHDKNSILKMSNAKLGSNNPNYGKSTPESTKQKISNSLKGIKRTKSTKEKMSNSAKNRIYHESKCPHCGKIGRNNMKRYHFDNCKYNENR